jgi:hypothetical protein
MHADRNTQHGGQGDKVCADVADGQHAVVCPQLAITE